jgi:hypothetical protein
MVGDLNGLCVAQFYLIDPSIQQNSDGNGSRRKRRSKDDSILNGEKLTAAVKRQTRHASYHRTRPDL